MKKFKLMALGNGTVSIFILFFILMPVVHALEIDPLIYEKLKTQSKVLVTIVLKEDSNIYSNLKFSHKELFERRKEYYKKAEDEVLSTLPKNEFELDYKYSIMNAFSGYITKNGIEKLKFDPNIVNIVADKEMRLLLDDSKNIINANDANMYLTGKGVTVCVIDGGIDWTHPGLGGCLGQYCKVLDGYDFYSNDSNPMDNFGHGTHVAGIVASTDGKYRGIAPDANLIAMKVCSDFGPICSTTAMQKGIDWCVNNASLYNIKVLTMSIGDGLSYNDPNCFPNDPLSISLNNAYNAGFFVSVASGNEGYTNGISFPACTKGATSVGATDKNNNVWSGTNRHQILDVLAPGVNIKSTNENWEGICNTFTEVGCDFVKDTGTSMATPHVAGIVALIYSSGYNQSPFELEGILKDSGTLLNVGGGLYVPLVNALSTLQIDWPTPEHDFRRTSFTLLKGDMPTASAVEKIAFVVQKNVTKEQVLKPIVADIDGNGAMETVTAVQPTKFGNVNKGL